MSNSLLRSQKVARPRPGRSHSCSVNHFILTPCSAQPRGHKQQTSSSDAAVSAEVKTARSGTPTKQEQRTGSSQPTAVKSTLTHDGKEGRDFPEVRTSKVDVDGTPTWANGKAITEVDIDADLAEHSKPWRLPGTDQTDFFNYGFDEYTWAQYCLRQSSMAGSIADQKQADANMKAMFGGGGAPGGGGGMPPGMPPMPGMPGMPSPEDSEWHCSLTTNKKCTNTTVQ